MTKDERLAEFNKFANDFISSEAKMWLIDNDFFTAPASSKYHGSYEGGLFDHSMNVALALTMLTEDNELVWSRPESPFIIGMFHDLCKTDQYKWNELYKKYEWNKDQAVLGHGDKSIIYIESHICKLTDEEKACIRWHMGAFDDKDNWTKYTNSIHEYPNVLWTHMADMMATHIIEVGEK